MQKKRKKPIERGRARVPVILQLEALECGAACLAMILAYYGKWIPLAKLREDCGVSRDGSKASNILIAARGYGMDAQGFRYEPEDLLNDGIFPCIVHWEFNHFIVLCGSKGDRVFVNDPARGDYSMSREDFDRGFTGVVLFLTPAEGFVPSGKPQSILEFAKKTVQGTGSAAIFVMLTTVISSVVTVISAGFSRFFMDYLLTGSDLRYLYPFLCFLAVFSFTQIIAAWIQAVYFFRINGKMAVTGSTSYLWKVLRLPMKFFSQRMAGDLQQRRVLNASIASSFVNTIAPLLLNTIMMVFYLVVMVRYSLLLTMVGLLTVLVNVAVSQYISRKRVNITRVLLRDQAKLSGSTVSGVEMIETIKSAGAENGFFRKWAGFQASVNAQDVRYKMTDAYLGVIPGFCSAAANILVLVLGVYLVMHGQFTVGMIMAFQSFMTAFLTPAGSLIEAGQVITETRSQMERLQDVMEYPEEIKEERITSAKGESMQKLSGNISVRHVTFGYSRLAKPLIEDFNLEIKAGSRIALVGASGCGKSTLSKLISGLYRPWEGEILFDGKPVDEIRRSVFTGSVAVVDQDITLFQDTIGNNIKMWDESVEDYEMILAARDAHLHEEIMQREGGYRYRILENGKDFSGGQRQRMEIARVLAQDPTIVILDEATSALDARTESEVVGAIKDRGVTCIVIAHRLSTIRDCDEILVMDKGKVAERGTHESLMKQNGLYRELITSE